MNYCETCGTKLIVKQHEEGLIPFCETCQTFVFPKFSVAMSTMILNQEKNRVLLIKQGKKEGYILTAGYVSLGESAEDTVRREVKEELSLNVIEAQFLRSRYFEKTNTLMLNFVSIVEDDDFTLKIDEVDEATWFTFDEATKAIRSNSLAEFFLLSFLNQAK